MDPIRARVQTAIQQAGSTPWLVGYDVVGIQEFVTANSRPKAMRGASELIRRFDQGCGRSPLCIFAGGGRGIELARDEAAAEARMRALADHFYQETRGGTLATAAVPYDARHAQACLQWLSMRLNAAKESLPRPVLRLPHDKTSRCADCLLFTATQDSPRPDAGGERICDRCAWALRAANEIDEVRQSLSDVSSPWIAAVSADGNNMGVFFDSLDSLEQYAAASEAVAQIFAEAHKTALASLGHSRYVSMVTGGDDIRVFLPPADLLRYVPALVRSVEQEAARCGDLGGLLRADQASALSQLGVGVGATVADGHIPAYRLIAAAQAREKDAKAACRDVRNGGNASQARSALDFSIWVTGEEVGERSQASKRSGAARDSRPLSMAADVWERFHAEVEALREVPTAQRAVLAQARELEDREFLNLFRYSVARSVAWQRWYTRCGLDWRRPETLSVYRPDAAHLDCLRLYQMGHSSASSSAAPPVPPALEKRGDDAGV
ncbi:MAG: hypothetical protein U1A78_33105 [Polyangia bacterium]